MRLRRGNPDEGATVN